MTWNQNYDPLGWWPLSTLVSALPVFTLFFVLLVLRKRVWVSALVRDGDGGRARRARLPACRRRSSPPPGLNGFVFGFFRIAWIIIASIYLYNVAVETGQFQVMKESIAGRVLGPAAAGDPDRVLLRGLPRGHGRRRGAGGDRRLVPHRPRLPALPGGDAVPPREHGARRVGRASATRSAS